MRFNPYEAPRAQGYSHFSGAQGEPEPWSIGEVFQLAWELYKQNWGPLTAGLFLTAMLSNIPSQTPNLLVALGVARETDPRRALLRIKTDQHMHAPPRISFPLTKAKG